MKRLGIILLVALACVVSASAQVPTAGHSAIPVAFASVSIDGTKQSGTSNVKTTFDTPSGLYLLTITGVNFNRIKFTTVATISGYNGAPLFINTDENGQGKLVVGLRDMNENLQKADFQVVVFKSK